MMNVREAALFGVSAIALGTAMTPAASAQTTSAAQAPATETAAPALEDIVVTAQRRSESTSRVPISITVVSGDQLAAKAVSTLQDVTLTTPNFQITQTGLTTQTFVRGIGSGTDPAFEQSVAQYIDGVNYGRAQLTRTPFFDVQRIEVLRGPQSILFGKNSTAGAVSIITAQPTNALHAGATATYIPTFRSVEGDAFVSGPLTDGLSGRVALRFLDDGGYVRNTFKNADEPRKREFAARGTLTFDKVAGFKATLKGEYNRFNLLGRDLSVIRDIATRTIAAGPLAGQPQTYANGLALVGLPGVLVDTTLDYRRQANLPEFDTTNLYNGTFTTETGVGGSVLTTVTGYVAYDRRSQVDLDFTSANIITGATRENFHQFSQEIRLATPARAPISFVGGLYYEHNRLGFTDITGFGTDLARLSASYAPIAGIGVSRIFSQTADSYAAFGQMTWRIIDRLRLIGGARVTHDREVGARRLFGIASQLDYAAPLITSPLQIAILQSGLRYSLDNVGGVGNNLNRERGKTRFVPSVTGEFDIAPEVLLFASYKEGYKSGGFDTRGNNNLAFGFDDETVESYEGGIRARLMDNRLSLGLTGYHSTYSNLQISQFDGTVGFNVGNAGKTRVQGFEADARIAVTRGVTLGTALSYLDAKYLDFRRGNCAFGETPNGDTVNGVRLCDYTGRAPRFAPKWNVSGSLSIDRPLTSALNLRGNVDASYKSPHNIHDNLDPLGRIAGYTIVDARAGVGGANWDIAVIGRNLLNEQFPTYAANVPFANAFGANTQYASVSRPRSVAIQVSLKY